MTNSRPTLEEIEKQRLTFKERTIIVALVLVIVGVSVYFKFGGRKSENELLSTVLPMQQVETPESLPELPPDPLEVLKAELKNPQHPLRKLIVKELGIGVPNRTIKRAALSLTPLNSQGKSMTAQWKEFRYKPWGGYFFQSTHQATLRTALENERWSLISCIDDDSDEWVNQYAGEPLSLTIPSDVLVRLWNDKSQYFTEFDETIAPFDAKKENVIIIHGMGSHTHSLWIHKMAQRIRKCKPDTNILAVDWSAVQAKNHAAFYENESGNFDRLTLDMLKMPVGTANRIPEVVEQVQHAFFGADGLQINPTKTDLIAFSHGAHIAGMLGMKRSKNPFRRLTVLDPSTRMVHLNSDNRWGKGWDRSAAKFVDMYASSQWAGSGKIYGHKTYFVTERGEKRPWYKPKDWDLFNTVPDHMYAAKWFLSTIGNNDSRFGYSIDTTQKSDPAWSGTILSTLPKQGEFDGINDPIMNEIGVY